MVYRAPASSLESCCFISDDEYLSGSDNGTVALWGMMKKKPGFLFRDAHPVVAGGISGKTYIWFVSVSFLMPLSL